MLRKSWCRRGDGDLGFRVIVFQSQPGTLKSPPMSRCAFGSPDALWRDVRSLSCWVRQQHQACSRHKHKVCACLSILCAPRAVRSRQPLRQVQHSCQGCYKQRQGRHLHDHLCPSCTLWKSGRISAVAIVGSSHVSVPKMMSSFRLSSR